MAGPIRVVRTREESARAVGVRGGDWVERFARFGLASRGVVYMIMGWIALRAALGSGEATGASGAIRSLVDEPLGRVLIGLIALGLAAYALWRAYAALANPERDSTGERVLHGVIAVVHGALAVTAARLALAAERRMLLRRVSRFGVAARSIVFAFVGLFVAKAALEYEPQEARGFGGALDSLHESLGAWPFAAVALGLVAYGVYGLIRARYRVVRTA